MAQETEPGHSGEAGRERERRERGKRRDQVRERLKWQNYEG